MEIWNGIKDGLGMIGGFIVGLIPLIIVHEFGHLIMAKLTGIWAREFGIGFPPRIARLFRWRETEFTLNWVPLGGFVRLEGEQAFAEENKNPDDDEEESPEKLAEKADAYAHSLYAKPPEKRILVYLGGPLMNLLIAWVLATLVFFTGIPTARVVIDQIMPASPAAEARLQVNDVIVAVNGEKVEGTGDVSRLTQKTLGQPTELTLEREGQTLTVSLVPRVNPPEGQGAMGIVVKGLENPGDLKRYPLGQALIYGSRYVGNVIGVSLMLPVYIIRGLIPIEQARPVGIIGISQIAQQSVEESIAASAVYPFLNFVILISVSLGIFNLLPIPALDGGRILFSVVEKVRHKPLTPAIEERIHTIALFILVVIFIFIAILDIVAPLPLP
ncbi:MAG TPA: M50 family metallopeptidase [Anaerolineae bacterium]|nr:M50 family metallopeptidase [Anaerolineae bacterium]HQK12991.1 M50 family metallopeptidase [Anaerolineae bacterium]